MKKMIVMVLFSLISNLAMAETVVSCIDGSRSMKVENKNGVMMGQLNDFDLKLNNMKCYFIPKTKTIRCDKDGYYVLIFEGSVTQKLTAQVNLNGDFGSDSGYLHSLDCQ